MIFKTQKLSPVLSVWAGSADAFGSANSIDNWHNTANGSGSAKLRGQSATQVFFEVQASL